MTEMRHECTDCHTLFDDLDRYVRHKQETYESHLCTRCHRVIQGLQSYIEHVKSNCTIPSLAQGNVNVCGTNMEVHSHITKQDHAIKVSVTALCRPYESHANQVAALSTSCASDQLLPTKSGAESVVKKMPKEMLKHKESALVSSNYTDFYESGEMPMVEDINNLENPNEEENLQFLVDMKDIQQGVLSLKCGKAEITSGQSKALVHVKETGDEKSHVYKNEGNFIKTEELSENSGNITEPNTPKRRNRKRGRKGGNLPKRTNTLHCVICDKSHTSKQNFLRHLEGRYPQRRVKMLPDSEILGQECQKMLLKQCRYQCLLCSFFCNTSEDMIRHIKMPKHVMKAKCKLPESFLKCRHCKFFCQSNSQLLKHMKNNSHVNKENDTEMPCIIETVVVHQPEIKEELDKNILQKSKRLLRQQLKGSLAGFHIRCLFCDHIAGSREAVIQHFSACHSEKVYECHICQEKFIDRNQLKIHKSRAHIPKEKKMEVETKCNYCSQTFLDDKKRQLHELGHNHVLSESAAINKDPFLGISEKYHDFIKSIHNLNTKSMVTCPECKKTFTQRNAYPHLRMHSNTKPFKCMLCSDSFIRASTLRNHLVHHLQIRDHKCLECGKFFFGIKDLRGHIQAMHNSTEDKKVVCHLCAEGFASQELWKRHFTLHHSERAFHCSHQGCTYSFRIKAHLDNHMLSHTRERPFLCEECGFAGKSIKLLKQHRKIHTATKVFPCEYCDYKGISAYHVKRHSRTHTRAQPYKCPYCSYGCKTIGNLKAHTNSKHEKRPVYCCKDCDFSTNIAVEMRSHMITSHSMEQMQVRDVMAQLGVYAQSDDLTKAPGGSTPIQVPDQDQDQEESSGEEYTLQSVESPASPATEELVRDVITSFGIAPTSDSDMVSSQG